MSDPYAGLATPEDPYAGVATPEDPYAGVATPEDPYAGLATPEVQAKSAESTAWFDRTVREQLPDGGVREQRVPDPFPGISEGAGAVSNWVNRRAGDVIGKVIGGVADEPIVQHVLRDPAAQTATAMLPVGWAAQGLKAATTLPAIAANAGRLGIAAGVGDVAMQGMQIAGGQRDAIDPQQTAAQTLAATAGGAVPGAGRVTSPLFAAKNPLTAMAAEVAVPAAGNSALGAGVNAATQLATTGTVDPGQMARAGVEWGTFGGLGGTANAIATAQAAAVDRAGLIGLAKSKGFTNWDDFFNWYGGQAPATPRATKPSAPSEPAGQLAEAPAAARPAAPVAPEPSAPAPVVPRAAQPPPPPTAEEIFMQTRAAELARRPAPPSTLEPAGAPNPGHPIPPSGAGIAQIQASPVRSAPGETPAPVSQPAEVAAPRADLFDGGATGGDTTFNLAAQVGTDFGGYMDEQAARAEALAAQERAQQALPLGELSPDEFLPVSPATAADVTGSGIGQDRSVLAAANPAAAGSAAVPTADFQQRRDAGNVAPAAPTRKFKLGSRLDGVPDVLDAIQELGGIGGPSSVRHQGGGEYDGFRSAFGQGAPRLLVKRGGQAVDQVIEQLHELGYHYDSPDALYSAVSRAAQDRQTAAQVVKAEQVQDKFMAAALGNEGRGEARTPNKGVPAITLPTGTKFKIHGAPFEVVGHDAQNNVIVRDGPEYGTQVVPAGADLYADKGSLRRAKGEQVAAMPFEPRGPEVAGGSSAILAQRLVSTVDEAAAVSAREIVGRPLRCEATGMLATVTRNSLHKMSSGKATLKSVDARAHALAVANIDHLFAAATPISEPQPDKSGDTNLRAIHRLQASMLTPEGAVARVKITVKEFARTSEGNRIYSVEAVDLEKAEPAGRRVASISDQDRRNNTPHAGSGDNDLQLHEDVNRPLAVDIFNETDGKPIKAALAAGNPASGDAGGGWRESVGAIEQAAQRAISDRLRGDADLADELAAATAPGGRGAVFRPAEIIGAVAGERLPGEMGTGGLARTGIITEHARAFTSQFIRDGYLDLLGRKFESPEQVVAALQWARNRACEVYWLFPYDKAGRMLPPVAITSRMPDRVWMPADSVGKINAHLRSIGAAYWDNAHNHPSGNPQPSAGDLAWTKTLRGLVTAAPMRHSLVIDHGRYAVIGDGTYSLGEITGIASRPDPTARPIGADAWLGRSLGKIADVVQAAYGAQSDTNSVLLHVVGSRTSVNSVASVGVGDLSAPGFTEQLRELARKTGGVTSVAYYSGDRPEVHDRLLQLADEGILFYARPGEIVARPNPEKAAKAWMGQPLPRYKQVAEDDEELAPYEPENVLSIEGDGGTQGTQKLGGMEHVRPVEMPELVQMCKELTGSVPDLRTLRKFRGLFKPGEVKIVLDRRIFADPVQAQKTLAHELGHLDDYLGGIPPTLARGNLLGRIATLKKYLKNELPNFGATAKEVKAELQAVSDWWRPWDRTTATPGFTRYRQSSVELYADALSVLYNSPEELKARAPLFWAGFWAYLGRKPEVSQQVHEIQTLLARGKLAVLRERSARLQASFAKGDEVFLAHAAERVNRSKNLNGIMAQAKQDHYDIYAPIVDRARKVKAAGKVLPWHKDPEHVFDAHPLVNNQNYVLLERVRRSVLDPIEAVGASDRLLGEYLLYNRVAHESYLRDGDQLGRAHLANPQGHTPQTARQGLLRMRIDYGQSFRRAANGKLERYGPPHPPIMEVVEESARKLQDMILDVVERGVAAGIYKPEALAHARENRYNYATFAVIDYLEESPHIPAGIKAQRGTLLDTANPFTASVLKLMTANKLIEHNQAKRVAIDLKRDHFPDEIMPAAVKKLTLANGSQITQPRPAPPGKAELMVLVGGKPEYYWVEPAIADMFESRPTASIWAEMRVLSYAFRNLFYPTFITYNPAFTFWLNPMRDAQRNWNKLPPGVSRAKFYGQQAAAKATAVARLKEQVTGPELARRRLLRQMAARRALTADETKELDLLDRRAEAIETIAVKALPGPYESFVANPTNRQDYWQTMLADYGLMEGTAMNWAWAHEHAAPVMKVLDKMSMAGAMMEVMPKAAGYRALRRDLGWSAQEAAYYVRNHVGTPPHFKKGKWAAFNGTLIPFINIMTQGWATDWQQMRGKIPISQVTPAQQRWSYWQRMATSTLLPRVLKCLAAAGLLGSGLKELYDAVGDYDDTNYLTVPLGKVTSGNPEYGYKTVVLRLPQDETSRVLGGMLDMALTRALSDEQQAKSILPLLNGFAGGQLPGVNPAVSLAEGWRQYLSGQNPIDNFRNQPLMSDWKFRAGGWASTQPMLAWSLEQTGATNLVRWDSKAETMMETVLSATPVLNRAVKITDQGFRDRDRNLQELQAKAAAQIRAAVGDDVNRLLAEHARLSALRSLGEDHLTPVQRDRYESLQMWYGKIWKEAREDMASDKERAQWPRLVKDLREESAAFLEK